MKVKAVYYLKTLPTKMAVVLPDGTARITNITPFRVVKDTELEPLLALENSTYRKYMLVDELPEYAYGPYGFEKIEA